MRMILLSPSSMLTLPMFWGVIRMYCLPKVALAPSIYGVSLLSLIWTRRVKHSPAFPQRDPG